MPLINVLDDITINKIAAGEVVEKPMAVIKELVENAIDAKSTAITVEIKNGGLDMMRITDNGCGIAAGEIEKAFFRHATSKIHNITDLEHLTSLGFRGEALASIAAVSMVECISKTSDNITGIRYEIEGGKEVSKKEIGCPDGTTFVVRNLFYNTPARRKFLKTPVTEGSYINDIMEKIALSHPEIAFKFINNGKVKLQTSGSGRLKDVIYNIYGRDITANIVEFNVDCELFKASGYIGKPIISKGNRTFMNYFVNGRYVKSPIIYRALEEGYEGFHMSHKYPFCVLLIDIDGQTVDVNVHPSKMEIRFSNADRIYSVLCNSVRDAIRNIDVIPLETMPEGKGAKSSELNIKSEPLDVKSRSASIKGPEPFEYARRANEAASSKASFNKTSYDTGSYDKRSSDKGSYDKSSFGRTAHDQSLYNKAQEKVLDIIADNVKSYDSKNDETDKNRPDNPSGKGEQMSLFQRNEMSFEKKKDFRIAGQIFSTYWIIEYHDDMYIMDQHAAHEKLLYEKFTRMIADNEVTIQQVSPPMVFTLSPVEAALLKDNMKQFSLLGFEIEHFGGNEYLVSGVPAMLPELAVNDVFMDIISSLEKENMSADRDSVIKDKIASMSCKAAVKGGMNLSFAEALSLVNDLFELENPFNCPHGRPTMIKMTKNELEKKFGRRL